MKFTNAQLNFLLTVTLGTSVILMLTLILLVLDLP